MTAPKPVVLCILDGWGKRAETMGNAPALANVPNYDRIMAGPTAELITHGPDVGLPRGQMGNSEVGHTNIGAGRVVAMDLGAIDLAIEENTFASEPALQDFIAKVKTSGGRAHLAGLLSDGGVHSHINHMIVAAQVLCDAGLEVVIHAITDGRDVAPKSALTYLKELRKSLPARARIGSVMGRYYAMDRDNRWERVQDAFNTMMYGDAGDRQFETAEAAIEAAYAADLTDEFIKPSVIGDDSATYDDDGLFFLNFRADRAREILSAMADPDFDAFDTHGADHDRSDLAAVLGMVDYSDHHTTFMTTVFPKKKIKNTIGSWVAQKGLRQFRVAETEKYPHVTFFLNGGIEVPEAGEDRYMAPSPKVATYDLQPEMSAAEVTDAFVGAINDGYDLIICNYANPDMVGHTGDIEAAIKACEAVDAGLGRVLEALEAAGGAMIVTADHGNCETMIDPETGGPHTAHTTNPVPVALVGGPTSAALRDGRLSDLAPTLLGLMGLDLPPEMTGKNLIK